MKAHINGTTVEGTPQEIAEYQRLQGNKKPRESYWGHGIVADLIPLQMSPMSMKEFEQHVKNLINEHGMY